MCLFLVSTQYFVIKISASVEILYSSTTSIYLSNSFGVRALSKIIFSIWDTKSEYLSVLYFFGFKAIYLIGIYSNSKGFSLIIRIAPTSSQYFKLFITCFLSKPSTRQAASSVLLLVTLSAHWTKPYKYTFMAVSSAFGIKSVINILSITVLLLLRASLLKEENGILPLNNF